MLKKMQKDLKADEIAVIEAGMHISDLQAAGIDRYVLRLATNFTARGNYLPAHTLGRKPTYGLSVRPLSRKHKGKTIEATIADETFSFLDDGREIRVEIWSKLILNKVVPGEDNKTFDVYVIPDPDFDQPWLLATPVMLKPESVRAIDQDRWRFAKQIVEQVPLSAKQMVGAHRQFVHNQESVQRLPELALLVGSVLSFVAATFPAMPTGFWDREPKRTPGRLRRQLASKAFPKDAQISGRLREKKSVTGHLPKGNLARSQKMAQTAAP
ncbi:MAG: hypothetical protein NTW32_19935 [Chloroflexi bacterium]|nr:hypothetical protein [Chloroflexota bacterium]